MDNNTIIIIEDIESNTINTIPITNEIISHIALCEKLIYESINSYTPVNIFTNNALAPVPPSKYEAVIATNQVVITISNNTFSPHILCCSISSS